MGLYITIGNDATPIEGSELPKHLGKNNRLVCARWFTEALAARGAQLFNVSEGHNSDLTEADADKLDSALQRYEAEPRGDIMREDYIAAMKWASAHIRRCLSRGEAARVIVD